MSDVNIQTFSGKVNVSNNFTVGSGHLFVDTQNNKVGLNTTTPEANLHVTGNTYISTDISVGGTLTMGTVTVEALHSLEAVTAVGKHDPLDCRISNTDTSLLSRRGNVEVSGNVTFPGDVDITSNKTGVYGEVESLTRIIGTPSSTQDVVSDDNGNYYVTSKVATDADILNADDTIHSSLTPASNACAVIVSYNALGEVQWVNQVNTQSTVSTNRLALHGDALYVCGAFSGSATFIRNSDGTFINRSANTGPVCFVMRITASTGAIEGISLIESSSNDTIRGITIDANGQVYVAGTMGSTSMTFTDSEGDATNVSLTSSNGKSAFMVKYTSSLTPKWVVQVDDLATITTEVGVGVDVDSDGNLYLCGYSSGTPTIRDTNGLSTVQQTSSLSGYGTFVIKFNSAGVAQKISTINSSGTDYTQDITVDSNDNVYVLYKLGKNTSTITDGDGITTSTVVAENSNTAAVVVKYDSELAAEWTAKVEIESSGGNVEPKRIVVDENGSVFITGGTSSNAAYKAIDSSGSVFAVGTPTGTYSGFVVSFDTNGKYVWGSCIDGPDSEFIDGIFYSNRNVYVTGVTYATSGNLTITNGNGSVETVDITSASLFIIRYNLKDAYALRVNNGAIVTGDLEVGTANLFVDTVSGRVGIGTDVPAYDFDVQSSSDAADKTMARLYSRENATGVSSTGLIFEKGTGYGGVIKGFISQGIGSGLSLHTLNGGTEAQSMTIMNSGNVGIGTNSPETKLDVNGVIKSAVPSWGVHQLATKTGLLRMTDTHATARNCTVALSTGNPARTRVTATVAGRYFVSFMAFSESTVPSGQSVQISLLKNGSTHARNYAIQPITNFSANGGIAVIVDLAVDDYLEIDSNNDLHHNANGYFSGFLIG
jgi:hypothetical protein